MTTMQRIMRVCRREFANPQPEGWHSTQTIGPDSESWDVFAYHGKLNYKLLYRIRESKTRYDGSSPVETTSFQVERVKGPTIKEWQLLGYQRQDLYPSQLIGYIDIDVCADLTRELSWMYRRDTEIYGIISRLNKTNEGAQLGLFDAAS